MFERFSDSARWAVVRAQEVAREHEHDYIGAEHLLLAVFEAAEQGRAPATRALLDRQGFTPQAALATVTLTRGQANHAEYGHIPFTTEAKTVLEHSLRESIALGDSLITPDHLLIGVIRAARGTADSVAGQVVANLRITADPIREVLGRTKVALSQRATKTLTRAGMEARRCDDTEIDTPHLLLALLATDPDLCRRVFDAAGADPERVRAELDAVLAPKE
ncbi:Clp protease N-terminal domain-containing protein [Nocardia alni]|uniref:Clp protease N-terminal domain-containing protein n=1 Tax=Nocardia alni TaxID=2815723 RepID=UPI001C22A456|nr:Clp protease N-terminal domain-containing protein [Nocardia alni]